MNTKVYLLRGYGFLVAFLWTVSVSAQCDQQQREQDYIALRALYLSTDGDNWGYNPGWLTEAEFVANPTMPLGTDMSTWYGVHVNVDGCVVCLNFDSFQNCDNTISGPSNNLLAGNIPPELGNLANLTTLVLAFNQNLEGNIPVELGNLANLTILNLYGASLSGSIPAELGNLTNLATLNLGYNSLTGNIPGELGNLTNLTTLDFRFNSLTGNVPFEIGNLINLEELRLDHNMLDGIIPPDIGNLINLKVLELSNNNFSGGIPLELGYLLDMNFLDLGSNQLSGGIPCQFGNFTNARYLSVADNNLTGSIPPQLGNLDTIWRLDLGHNQLSGSIPASLGNLGTIPNIDRVYLDSNQLTGCYHNNLLNLCFPAVSTYTSGNDFDVPWSDFCDNGEGTCLCDEDDYIALRALYLSTDGNNWTDNTGWLTEAEFIANPIMPTGTNIDTWYGVNVGADECVSGLFLSNNELNGIIPPEIGDLSSLVELWLDENDIIGNIPSAIGNLGILSVLRLNGNNLIGSIPSELRNLCDLSSLDLNNNDLSGCYDASLLTLCDQFENSEISAGNNFDTSWECFCEHKICNISPISTMLSSLDPSCNDNDGSIELTVSGGVAPYTYDWSNGDNVEDPDSLSADIYIIQVSDSETCNAIAIDTVIISVPTPPIIDSIEIADVLCRDDGALTIITSDGTPPYEYSMDNGINFQLENSFLNLLANTYEIVVRDTENCVTNKSVMISDNTPVVNLGQDMQLCDPNSTILATGYDSSQWSNGEMGEEIIVDNYGTYSVTVTDADCKVTDTIVLEDMIHFYASTVDTMIARGEDVDITVSGADSYVWTPTTGLNCATCDNDSIVIASPENSTLYTVTASVDGCQKNFTIRVGIGGPSVFPPGGVLIFPELADPDAFPRNQFSVYNRHGLRVFHAQPYDNTWDGTYLGNGTPLPPGNYYYIMEFEVTVNNVIKQRLFIGR